MTIRHDIEKNQASEIEAYEKLEPTIKKKLEWFKDQKLGVIFHWGLYSEAGIVESWQLSKEDSWARKKGAWRKNLSTLRKDYWNLQTTFNPEKFDPKVWANLMKTNGFKYMLFTSKHHDGFNMFDTEFSNYKITSKDSGFHTNPHADILKYINQAFREVGISVGTYYSKADWHSPYYWEPNSDPIGRYASYDPEMKPDTWCKFNQYVENQLTELVGNYGPIDILWLDGGWVNRDNHEFLKMNQIVSKLRQIQPDLLVVDRTIGGRFENYVTPEREIPEQPPLKAWESNIPLAKNWGYVPNDHYKSFEDILETFVKVVALGGNLILGVGPKPDGTLPNESVSLVKKLGKWLKRFGKAIYGTRPVPELKFKNCFLTKKENHLFIFYEGKHSPLTIPFSQLPQKISSAVLIDSQKPLKISEKELSLPKTNEQFGCVELVLAKS